MPDEPSPGFKIICSQAVTMAFRQVVERAFSLGIGREVLAASKVLVRRLTIELLIMGEPVHRLRALELKSRIAIERPLAVAYSVHEEKRLVFIKHFKLLPGHDAVSP